jgi:hypothetical protein
MRGSAVCRVCTGGRVCEVDRVTSDVGLMRKEALATINIALRTSTSDAMAVALVSGLRVRWLGAHGLERSGTVSSLLQNSAPCKIWDVAKFVLDRLRSRVPSDCCQHGTVRIGNLRRIIQLCESCYKTQHLARFGMLQNLCLNDCVLEYRPTAARTAPSELATYDASSCCAELDRRGL